MYDKIREIAARIYYDTRSYGEVVQHLETLAKLIEDDVKNRNRVVKERSKKVDKK